MCHAMYGCGSLTRFQCHLRSCRAIIHPQKARSANVLGLIGALECLRGCPAHAFV